MHVYLTKWMSRYIRREKIPCVDLLAAIERAEHGSIDANLGGGLIKQRIARKGKGRSGGFRTIIAYRRGQRAFFIFGFAKSERGNIGRDELASAREIGAILINAREDMLARKVAEGELEEITNGAEEA